MESVRQSCRPKHQVLILKCYPRYQKGVSEVNPNPSELSYLLYYASTRRSKLTKVGAFLEKRVARDVWRRRLGNVQVALHILTALIEKVPRDLPIYARSVLTVIDTVLRSNDITMVEDSIETFETFCQHQDMTAIAADQRLANQYRDVVQTYASFANPVTASPSLSRPSPPIAIRWRTVGLRAIKGVVSSESFAADGGMSLKIILPVILENLYSGEENILVTLQVKLREAEKSEQRDAARRRRLSVQTVQTVDKTEGDAALAASSAADSDRQAELDARLLALRCLEQIIVSGSDRGQIRLAATIILRFISNKRIPEASGNSQSSSAETNGNWATSLIEIVANWCPVQVRFVILITAMEILHGTSAKESDLESLFTILSVVDWLLKSSVNMIGLSVMDVLYGLMHYVSHVLLPHAAGSGKKEDAHAGNDEFMSLRRKDLLSLLEQCIGDLATHIYYGDQIGDMVRAILRRLQPTASHETSAPSTLATVHETATAPAGSTNPPADSNDGKVNGEKTSDELLSDVAAKLTALRAVKAILTVANLRTPAASAGVESRNPVGVHVWEGSQGLLRDSDCEVRYAYADALLSWLQLETNKDDLKARVNVPKQIKSSAKRESEQGDKSSRRNTSVSGNQREKVVLAAQTNFLRLLHLAIYDSALANATDVSEVLLLHLLLVSLIENLGVNAAQFGLPMVLKLQDDLVTSLNLGSATARVNVGSLVHGYLLALTKKFDLESSQVGVEIRNEIEKRQSKEQWLSKIRLPPLGLGGITSDDEKVTVDNDSTPPMLTPFRHVETLVNQIDEAYRQSATSPPHSPPASPARGFSFPVLNHIATQAHPEGGLPPLVREQMLVSWSREGCLAAAEQESIRTASITASRVGTLTARNNNNHADWSANGSPAGSASQSKRPMSVPESSGMGLTSSSRGSLVRVNELRRVLSVHEAAGGRLDASNSSIMSSDSESMVSGNFSLSEVEGEAPSAQPQDGDMAPNGDGTETPRASTSAAAPGDKTPTQQAQSPALDQPNSDVIPPVPPIPASLNIPGGFPSDSQRSLTSDRPYTAPGPSESSLKENGVPSDSRKKTLARNKSRSTNSLSGAAPHKDLQSDFANLRSSDEVNGGPSIDSSQRDQLRKLLDGFTSLDDSALANGDRSASAKLLSKHHSVRQVSQRGIGRPPY